MHKIIARAPAKLNLTFDIVGTLLNGYHEVATLYQALDLEDELTFEIEPASTTSIEIIAAGHEVVPDFPADESNLISKSIEYFLSSLPGNPAVKIKAQVEKNIPIAAGMGGGSSDAAATLVALNLFFGHPFGKEELLALSSKLGADVPFCLEGGTCIGRGRGDDLTQIRPAAGLSFLLVKPNSLSISTPWAYSAFDEFTGIGEHPDLAAAVEALTSGDRQRMADSFGNAFEPLIFTRFPALHSLQKLLLELGAWCAHLTGKGPTFYALVENREMACRLREQLLEKYIQEQGAGRAQTLNCLVAESVQYGARLTGERIVNAC
jgi:4-diphosphocytidyl-2-C-methyl-D-erythritol kinase